MARKIFTGVLLLAVCVMACVLTSCTLFNKGARARVNFLIVSANYLQPRVLCELAQYYSKQPVIIVQPGNGGEEARLFYMSNNRKAEEIAMANYGEFVEFLNPRVVLFVGGDDCYTKEVVEQARNKYRVMIINGADWEQNAQMLGEILEQPRLSRQFKDAMAKISEAGNLPAPEK